MGKRNKKRNQTKNIQKPQTRADNQSASLLAEAELSVLDSPEESEELLKHVRSCIEEIYLEHRNDLNTRKNKRFSLKQPTEFIQPYNLIVNWQFQHKIRVKIQALIKLSLGEVLKESVISLMNDFIDYLQSFLKDLEGKRCLLRGIMLYETYHTLQNSIDQVGNIISDLVTKYSFELSNKKTFYQKIAISQMDVIEEVRKNETSKYIDDLVKMKTDLLSFEKKNNETLFKLDCRSTVHTDCDSQAGCSSDALHNLDLDELVEILNSEKNRKKKKPKKKMKSVEDTSDDFGVNAEVEEFVLVLEKIKAAETREKPAVSSEFLVALREKLKGRNLKSV